MQLAGCGWIFRLDYLDEPPPIVGRWVVVAGGEDHTCAIDDKALLRCWGRNDWGQLGRVSWRIAPVQVP